jgi:hypothetical protein
MKTELLGLKTLCTKYENLGLWQIFRFLGVCENFDGQMAEPNPVCWILDLAKI